MYKKLIYSLALVAVVTIAFLFNSCQEIPMSPPLGTGIQTDAGNGCTVPNQFCGSPGTIEIQNSCPGDVQTIDLWAGNPPNSALVGKVELFPTTDAGIWTVKYTFTDPSFTASSIHFAISCTLSGIPQTNKQNPIPGQFPYSFNGPFANPFTFNVTLPTGCGSCFYVAAHAGGTFGTSLSGFNLAIPPGCVTLSNVSHGFLESSPDTGCYWQFTLSNAGAFNGTFCGWCIDLAHDYVYNTWTCARVYSSLVPSSIPTCDIGFPYIDHPENFPAVNYLINNYHPGQTVNLTNSDCSLAGGTGVINVIDIQKAIWMLLDEGPGNEYSWLSNPLRVNAIYCDAINHNNFVPNCDNGDVIAFVVIPDGQNCPFTVQPIIGFAPCMGGGGAGVTAWGDGKYGANFPGNNWATYFKWCTTCP